MYFFKAVWEIPILPGVVFVAEVLVREDMNC
jgi:hypothetical protein